MKTLLAAAGGLVLVAAAAAQPACQAVSPATITPVIELYTSEGCSSCPPADRWVSSLKPVAARGGAVVEAFHVGYWDSLGWVDRFASPAFTQRQRDIASRNAQSTVYTPQVVRNGRDWRDWSKATAVGASARAGLSVRKGAGDAYTATVQPAAGVGSWSAYWTVTEHGHASKVAAGENAGEFLQHDFVVRQYVVAGEYRGAATLEFRAVPATPGHPRQVNLVVFDPRTGGTLQALAIHC